MSILRFVVAGLGHIGKRHVSILKGHPDCLPVAVVDTDLALKTWAKEQGLPLFESLEAFAESGVGADVACICTPNGTHAPLSIEAMKLGMHVVCEKPMAMGKAACEQMIDTSLRTGKQIFVVKQNRYSPQVKWLKEVVDSGKMGKVFMVQVNCYWNRDDRYYAGSAWKGTLALDGGPLYTQFSHFVDVMYWLFGDVKDIQAAFDNYRHRHNTEFEDSGSIHFRFDGGATGMFQFTTAVHGANLESSITIIAEQGSIRLGGQYMDHVDYCRVEGYTMPELEEAAPPNDYGTYKGSAANHHFVFQNVVDTLAGRGAATANALEGMKVVDIIERFYAERPVFRKH